MLHIFLQKLCDGKAGDEEGGEHHGQGQEGDKNFKIFPRVLSCQFRMLHLYPHQVSQYHHRTLGLRGVV